MYNNQKQQQHSNPIQIGAGIAKGNFRFYGQYKGGVQNMFRDEIRLQGWPLVALLCTVLLSVYVNLLFFH